MIIGSTISHYKIVEKLGEGGMGVVYKAEDTKLERTVALKFLAQHLLNDDEAKERFLREAKAAAALHHSNVCPVHEIDEVDGKTFLAMAFLEGEPLEERIVQGPLAIKDALDIARQVADGLDAAHEKAIVHRDIKPANIMVDAKGHATIMDFGLARLTEASRLTKVDTAMGTVAYMSPEQAQGMEVDHRSDVWSLGCVLYEMVSGQRPFLGQYDQALLYEIVHEEVAPLTSVRAGVPMELEFILGECLAKDRDDRTSAAQDLARKLRTLGEKLKSGRSTILRTTVAASPPTGTTSFASGPDPSPISQRGMRVLQVTAAVLAAALLAVSYAYVSRPEPSEPARAVRRFSFTQQGLLQGALSPDGRHLAFVVVDNNERSLWLRTLADETPRLVARYSAGGRQNAPRPEIAWSSDSSQFVFEADYQLKRASIDGGEPAVLCDLPDTSGSHFVGASWSQDDSRIVFSSGRSLWQVSSRGGEPQLLLEPAGDEISFFRDPHFLPASEKLLFVAGERNEPRIQAVDLGTGERREIVSGQRPVFSDSGHLIYQRAAGVVAAPFSAEDLALLGDPFPIEAGASFPSISRDGTLAVMRASSGDRQIVLRDRSGEVVQTVGERAPRMQGLDVAPDGRRVAVMVGGDVWVYNIERNVGARLTSRRGVERAPNWLSDEEVSYAIGADRLATRTADGSSEENVLIDSAPGLFFHDWSSDGRNLIHTGPDLEAGGGGLWFRERDPSDGRLSEPAKYLFTPSQENQPQFSPNGRYVAYRADESGRYEVYVRPFPSADRKWQVSSGGGALPRWSADGTELFYWEGSRLMAAAVSTAGEFSVEPPQAEPPQFLLESPTAFAYDVMPDGEGILIVEPVSERGTSPTVHIVENWAEEFRESKQ